MGINFEAEQKRIAQDAHSGKASSKEAVAKLAALAMVETLKKGKKRKQQSSRS